MTIITIEQTNYANVKNSDPHTYKCYEYKNAFHYLQKISHWIPSSTAAVKFSYFVWAMTSGCCKQYKAQKNTSRDF